MKVIFQCDCGWTIEQPKYTSGVLCPKCQKVCSPTIHPIDRIPIEDVITYMKDDHLNFTTVTAEELGSPCYADIPPNTVVGFTFPARFWYQEEEYGDD